MRIAVCDDEKHQTEYLTKLVNAWADERGLRVTVRGYGGAGEYLFAGECFDVLLLDIQMDGQSGLELARELRTRDENLLIIFITAYEDYAREGYEVSALRYLMKPVDERQLYAALDNARRRLSKPKKFIIAEERGEYIRLPQEDILYAESFDHYIKLMTGRGSYTVRMKASAFDAEAEGFVRCHRSYSVNLKYVRRITRVGLMLDDGSVIPVSRRLFDKLNSAFVKYYKGEAE
jgi:DNA-binding LytR/AlgR family response regulator